MQCSDGIWFVRDLRSRGTEFAGPFWKHELALLLVVVLECQCRGAGDRGQGPEGGGRRAVAVRLCWLEFQVVVVVAVQDVWEDSDDRRWKRVCKLFSCGLGFPRRGSVAATQSGLSLGVSTL
ncbi:uncharacterized protein HMPREF1120_05084 [Exophiala dermatitidis NIH/UT8656]|uniref:Uncharacterized protein n=1 Tax=Exophiala dermatitidis (strain ATCC 34100 / CBS 525.76 / NIH/UT8656) TaxID=858893 RepID=H6BZG8_EXODN|nr:uncharacterized protein HMPREF1120_05084 [Exophiala dermatitidis NIH/UT8656]EHY57032.1 hypothetical protein HMPREF1120_05084 [Exophiala dermatitidis NIH/UT8656]KAJ4663852.1 hypothetical protein HRR92_008498 [Exophiala dermatitidis]